MKRNISKMADQNWPVNHKIPAWYWQWHLVETQTTISNWENWVFFPPDHMSSDLYFDKWPEILKIFRTILYWNVWEIFIFVIVTMVKLGKCPPELFGGQQKHWQLSFLGDFIEFTFLFLWSVTICMFYFQMQAIRRSISGQMALPQITRISRHGQAPHM